MGVDRIATQDETKRAYRKLLRKYHPDVNAGPGAAEAEATFKDVGEAYEVLQDPKKRAAKYKAGQGFEFSGGGYTGAAQNVFGSFFDKLFARSGLAMASRTICF